MPRRAEIERDATAEEGRRVKHVRSHRKEEQGQERRNQIRAGGERESTIEKIHRSPSRADAQSLREDRWIEDNRNSITSSIITSNLRISLIQIRNPITTSSKEQVNAILLLHLLPYPYNLPKLPPSWPSANGPPDTGTWPTWSSTSPAFKHMSKRPRFKPQRHQKK